MDKGADVGFSGPSGKHLLGLSFTGFVMGFG
jgi:hypothetical protein